MNLQEKATLDLVLRMVRLTDTAKKKITLVLDISESQGLTPQQTAELLTWILQAQWEG